MTNRVRRPLSKTLEKKSKIGLLEKYRPERARLYADLRAEGIAFEVLLAAETVHGFRGEESPRLDWQKDYWRQRDALEKKIEDIRAHPLVLHIEDPIFREPGPHCPHRRNRLECEEMHSLLSICRRPLAWPRAPRNAVQAAFERRERARKDLAGYNLGPPEKLRLNDFCKSPALPEASERWDKLPKRKVGRPYRTRKSVLEAVMAALKQCSLSQRKKLEYVERVLRYCFDDEKADAEKLAPRWRELEQRKPKPDASGCFPFE